MSVFPNQDETALYGCHPTSNWLCVYMLTGSRQTTAMSWDHCVQMVYLSNALTDVLKVKRAGGERS